MCNYMVRITTVKKSTDCLKRRCVTRNWKCKDSGQLSLDEGTISTGFLRLS